MPVRVTARQIKLAAACEGELERFKHTFPRGAEYPADIPKAIAAGLSLDWARDNLGLMLPLTEDIPEAVGASSRG